MSTHVVSTRVAERVLKEASIAQIDRRDEAVYEVAASVHSEKGAAKKVQLTFSGANGASVVDVILSPDDVSAVLSVLGEACRYLD